MPLWLKAATLTLLFSLTGTLLAAPDSAETRKQLEQLTRKLDKLQKQLSKKRGEKSSLSNALRDAEKAINRVQKQIREQNQQLAKQRQRLTELQQKRSNLQQQRNQQQRQIARQIQSAYLLGKEKKVKLLLNQEQPDRLNRALVYYDYFNQARAEQMEGYRKLIVELDQIEPAINQQTAELQATRDSLLAQQNTLKSQYEDREVALAKLNTEISQQGQAIQSLERNRKELEQILKTITEQLADIEIPTDYRAFHTMRGKMRWPVRGREANRYGARKPGSTLRWQGILLNARQGTPVNAIHHGRVVFADWLRGMGLLLIVDHGDGYMSLYGHNETLLKDVGDWVTPGETIATVGNSGGRERAGLYFEVRHKGKPSNPRIWCG